LSPCILFICHPECNEGSFPLKDVKILHYVQDDRKNVIHSNDAFSLVVVAHGHGRLIRKFNTEDTG
jgi:hypothetical protein